MSHRACITLSGVKRSITVAMAAAAAFALAGCGVGIYSETAQKVPSVPGVNPAPAPGPDGAGTVSVRNAMLAYPGVEGYKSGADATVLVWLFNDTGNPVTVTFRTSAGTVTPEGPITIAPNSYAAPDVKIKLSRDVGTDKSVPVTIEFSGVKPFELELPMAPPTAPVPAEKVEFEEGSGSGH